MNNLKKVILIFLSLLLLLFVLTVLYLSSVVGYSKMVNILNVAVWSRGSDRESLDFWLKNSPVGNINGVLINYDSNSISIWNFKGTQKYLLDQSTVFQYFDVCNLNNTSDNVNTEVIIVSRNAWFSMSLKNYIQVSFANVDGKIFVYNAKLFTGFPFVSNNTLRCIKP